MNLILLVTTIGLILQYFLAAAFKFSILETELLLHGLIRFLTGFFLLGIGVFYAHSLKFKSAAAIALALVLTDDVADYFRQVDSFKPEVMLYSLYMMLWGAVMGFVVMRNWRRRKPAP